MLRSTPCRIANPHRMCSPWRTAPYCPSGTDPARTISTGFSLCRKNGDVLDCSAPTACGAGGIRHNAGLWIEIVRRGIGRRIGDRRSACCTTRACWSEVCRNLCFTPSGNPVVDPVGAGRLLWKNRSDKRCTLHSIVDFVLLKMGHRVNHRPLPLRSGTRK